MKPFVLREVQRLPISLAEAWSFFSDPRNLPRITPPSLGLEPTSVLPEGMYPGMIVTYNVRPIPWVPVRWVTEITHVREPVLFVDEQRFGPYRFWHHEHHFRKVEGGVEMEDLVLYALPLGWVGRVFGGPLVRRRLEQIFSFRRRCLAREFGPAVPAAVADTAGDDRNRGLEYIRRMDPAFDGKGFGETATDAFFRLQGGWTRRDLSPVSGLLTDEMRATLQADADALKAKGQINRLENISVRNVEITEAWQESGQDFVTVLFQANLLDYTTDEAGKVLSGSDSVPVKFEEFWTFTRPVGPGAWRLSAIQQAS